MWLFIKRYPAKLWPWYLAGFLALILTNIVTISIPLQVKTIIDLMPVNTTLFSEIKPHLLWLIGLAVVLGLTRIGSRVFIFVPGRLVEYRVRNDLYQHLLTLNARFFRSNSLGDIMSRVINDIQNLRLMSALGFLHITNTAMMYGFVLYQMFKIHWKLTLFTLIPYPLILLVVRGIVRVMYRYNKKSQKLLGQLTTFFVEALGNIQLIKAYQAETAFKEELKRENKDFKDTNIKLAFIRGTLFSFIGIIGSVGQVILFIVGGMLIIDSKLSLGDFVAFSAYLALLAWPTASFAWMINIFQRGRVALDRLQMIFDTQPDICDDEHTNHKLSVSSPPHISVKNLSFCFENEKNLVLKDISFDIQPGEVLGIFGGTGSGKSILARLLSRQEPLPKQSVYLNDQPYENYPLNELRSAISYSSQNPFLFSDTIAANIHTFGTPLLKSDQFPASIQSAARSAQVHEDILGFPNQYETVIGEKGIILSGGQKSRISLARALFKPHQLLILDDVLSAVDHNTEHELIEMLKGLSPRPTMIIISHRISALAICDQILVLDKGEMIDSGTHSQLVRRDGIYRDTWRYQKAMS